MIPPDTLDAIRFLRAHAQRWFDEAIKAESGREALKYATWAERLRRAADIMQELAR